MENKDNKDFSLKGFEKTLNPKTIKYLDAKTKTMDKIDLRELSDDVNQNTIIETRL